MKPVTLSPPPTAPTQHAAPAAPEAAWPGLVSLTLVILVALALLLAVTAQRGPSPAQASAPFAVEQPASE